MSLHNGSSDQEWSLSILKKIDSVCDDFESAWHSGSRLAIENLLSRHKDLPKASLLAHLLGVELDLLQAAGQQPSLSDYRSRFPGFENVVSAAWKAYEANAPSPDMAFTVSYHQSPDDFSPLPDQIGPYVVKKFLGKGSFGSVYQAHDSRTGSWVALKVPHSGTMESEKQKEIIRGEFRSGKNLDHPNIVKTIDILEVDKLLVIVQDFIDGSNLTDWFAKTQPSPEQVVHLLVPVARALGYLHEQGLFHRDLKPGNILVDQSGAAYLADFGLALHENQQRDRDRRGEVAGTYAYMAPEQFRGEIRLIDGQSDLWSFGVILYRLLTDRYPFGGPPPRNKSDQSEYFHDLKNEIEDHDPRPPRQINPAISRKLEQICLRCLEKRKRDRYQTGFDLAEDLRLVFDRPGISSTHPIRGNTLNLVPKGLRSFEADDAAFFLDLLPGSRNLEGIPSSLMFWKRRLTEKDGDGAIDVGVLYGPSGCGKSSLIKAGLIPLLGDKYVSLVVEATPNDTEVRLLKAIRQIAPGLQADLSLVDACRLLGEKGAPGGRKVLLVLDQFEQWLHAHTNPEGEQLLVALRNCNGISFQCLLLVRDDFWMPLTRFMQRLEIPLVDDKNMASVDLFDFDHAKKVLAGFGKAYGRLPANEMELNKAQRQFLDSAVQGLSEDRRIVCVRLALFAEMMKDRPWTPGELERIGGAKGIGVAFLEEKFGRNAQARYRPHRNGARKILEALLPPPGGKLKGQMRTARDLRQAYESVQGPSFEQIIQILDTELKILTPVVPDQTFSQGRDGQDQPPQDHFQLTHDFLVPSIRGWLAAEELGTPEGRARAQLRDLALAWNAKPDKRRLPTFWEWVAIKRFTAPSARTEPERRMLAVAGRRILSRTAIGASVILVLVMGAQYLRGRIAEDRERKDAENLVQQIRVAEPMQVLRLAAENRPVSRALVEKLAEITEDQTLDKKVRLRLALFRAGTLPGNIDYLSEQLLVASPPEFEAIATLPPPLFAPFLPDYWKVLRDPSQSPARRFRAGCALSRWAPDDPAWVDCLNDFVPMLVTESPANVSHWEPSLLPAANILVEPVRGEFIQKDNPDTSYVAAMVLAGFFRDQPEKLADLALSAQPRQLAVIVRFLENHPVVGVQLLESKLGNPPLGKSGSELEEHRKVQARAATALMVLGQAKNVWNLLRHGPDPRVRNYVIHWAPAAGVLPDLLNKQFRMENDPSVRQALILMLGEFGRDRIQESWKARECALLERDYHEDPDPGIHSSLEWLFHKWGHVSRVPSQKTIGRKWFANSQEMTMVILDVPGSDQNKPRKVAVSAHKVSIQKFSLWSKNRQQPADGGLPIGGVKLADAARFCNWLSQQDGIPKDEWAYLENGEMTPLIFQAEDFISRKGYRLPTVLEWNHACLAGAGTSRPFGDNDDLLPSHAWYAANSNGELKPNGLLKPNRFGLFDMLGNLAEMTHPEKPFPKDQQASIIYLGGMSYRQGPGPSAIEKGRQFAVISTGNVNHGFRVVKTVD